MRSYELAKREIRSLVFAKRSLSLAGTVGLPVVIALLISFYDEIAAVHEWLFWTLLSVFVLAQAALSWAIWSGPQLMQEAYFEARDLHDENIALKQEIGRLHEVVGYFTIFEEAANTWGAMERAYLDRSFDSLADFEEPAAEMMAIVVNNRQGLFGCAPRELWNFALYLYEPDRRLLLPIWREKSEAHPSSDKGREWSPGEGHVGRAFQSGTTIITTQAAGDAGELLKLSPTKQRDYDARAYQSYASVPLGPIEEGGQALGVLVATSDAVGRFDMANCLILRHVALVLSSVIDLSRKAGKGKNTHGSTGSGDGR